MNKKTMAAAVASALGVAMSGAALAQTSTVQIGGFLNTLYYQHSPNNSSAGKKADISEQSESNFYITGEEKLGGGLSAWFRCENDITGASGGTATALGTCTRNSGLGIKGSFGNVFMGNWDMPQKSVVNMGKGWFSGTNTLYGGSVRLLDNGSASGAGNPSGITGSGNGSFYRRQSNSIQYRSPSWNGFSFGAGYSATNEAVTLPEANPLKPRMYSLAAEYKSGPLEVGFAYEQHSDYNPASQAVVAAYIGGDDTQWTLAAAYTFANQLRLGARYSDSEFETVTAGAAPGQTLDIKGWQIMADWRIQGPHSVKALYATVEGGGNSTVSVGRAVTPVVTGGLGESADVWTLAYTYDFSKRTNLSFAYNKMSNDQGTQYSLGKVQGTSGGNQKSIGIALYHRF